jgi:outer membrane protein TolC
MWPILLLKVLKQHKMKKILFKRRRSNVFLINTNKRPPVLEKVSILKLIFLLFSIFIMGYLSAQKQIKLDECLQNALIHHPLMTQKTLVGQESELQNEQYKKDLLPQFTVNGQASYQNEVISLPIDMPNFNVPELSKDQYRMSLDVNQVIYRGGLYQKQKDMEELQIILDQLEVDKNLYLIKNDVKELFMTIVLLDKQKKVTQSYLKRITAKNQELQAMVEEGVALPSVRDRLYIEEIKAQQQLDEIRIKRAALLNNLQLLTGMDLSGTIELQVFPPQIEDAQQVRFEYKLMSQTQIQLEQNKQLIDVQKYPKLFAFAQGGYGRPGFNYLSDKFSEFWMVGLRLQWNLFNWNKFNNDKKMVDIKIQMIDTQKQDFERNIQMALNQMKSEIESWQSLLDKDPEIIRLRESVAKNAANQLDEGIITTSAYIDEVQLLSLAELEMKIHEVQLINSQLSYLNILGKL